MYRSSRRVVAGLVFILVVVAFTHRYWQVYHRPHPHVPPPVTYVKDRPEPLPSPVYVISTPAPVPSLGKGEPFVIKTEQQALINQDRAAYGLGPLTWSKCLYVVALNNAQRMAAQGFISHAGGASQDLACGLDAQGGENVGEWFAGIDDANMNHGFMGSPPHKANILGPYRYVATAWILADGHGYVAVEFN